MLLLSWLINRQDYRDFENARKARKGKKECMRESASVREKERTGGMTMNEIDYKEGRVRDTRHVKFRGTSFVR